MPRKEPFPHQSSSPPPSSHNDIRCGSCGFSGLSKSHACPQCGHSATVVNSDIITKVVDNKSDDLWK